MRCSIGSGPRWKGITVRNKMGLIFLIEFLFGGIVPRMVKIFDRFEKAGLAATTSLFGLPSPPPR
jgi:hypothetical protein